MGSTSSTAHRRQFCRALHSFSKYSFTLSKLRFREFRAPKTIACSTTSEVRLADGVGCVNILLVIRCLLPHATRAHEK